jgi:rfaE bifunctional protein nucleotidyltransferase chain/domain
MPVYTAEALASIIQDARAAGRTVGLCHGCFDILHIGHVRHLTAAKEQCDLLFVSITGDRFINKGPDRPIIPQEERAEVLGSLRVVDGVLINQAPSSVGLLTLLRPNYYFKGQEYVDLDDPNFLNEKAVGASVGVEVRHTFEKVCSSSKIIHAIRKPVLG